MVVGNKDGGGSGTLRFEQGSYLLLVLGHKQRVGGPSTRHRIVSLMKPIYKEIWSKNGGGHGSCSAGRGVVGVARLRSCHDCRSRGTYVPFTGVISIRGLNSSPPSPTLRVLLLLRT